MYTPQEIIVWHILPALRREFTVYLKTKDLKQKDIAKKLGITCPAVSQYVKNKRATEIEFTDDIKLAIDKAADNMIKNKSCHRGEIQKVISLITRTGFLCKIHRMHDDVPACCNVCLKGDI